MPICRVCKKPMSSIAAVANDNHSCASVVRIPSTEILSQPSAVHRLAMAYRAKNLPRRKILDFVAEHLYQHEGQLLYRGSKVSFDDEVDAVFGTDRDPSERWLDV